MFSYAFLNQKINQLPIFEKKMKNGVWDKKFEWKIEKTHPFSMLHFLRKQISFKASKPLLLKYAEASRFA